MNVGDDPYQLLGVAPNADYDEIKKNYRKLALKQHPDKGGDPALFAKIANAYEIVSDPKQRHNYDLQQKHGSSKGYDPKAPEFTSTQDDYDPSKPQPSQSRSMPRTSTTTTYSNDNDSEEWTYTSTPMPRTSTKTYTSSSMPTSTKKTTTTTSFHFQDPMELFRQHFPDAAKHHNMPKTSNKTKAKPNMSSCSSSGDREVMGMASSTRTITHPNGQQELITETLITYSDGSTETKSESKPLGGKMTSQSIPMTMMKSPTTKTKTTSVKPMKMTTTKMSSTPIMTTTTTTKTMKPTKQTTTITTSRTSTSSSIPMTTTTSKKKTTTTTTSSSSSSAPKGNKTIVIKNGKPIKQ